MTPAPCAIHAPLTLTAGPDLDRLLAAIAQVERVRGSHRHGPKGERGVLQFKRETWEQFTWLPFDNAENEADCLAVGRIALQHYRFQLLERHIEPTPFLLALAWHCGLNGAILRGFQSQDVKSYAERVCALYRAN